ncbi:MAG: glycosyltransferase family 1 protein [Candidatus Peregrinibacteria bacterium]
MKIAIDIREAGGERAGKGNYTFHITKNLLDLDPYNEYILYTQALLAGFDEYKNAEIRVIEKTGLTWHRKVAKDAKKSKVDIFFAPTSYIIPTILPPHIHTFLTVHDLVAFLHPETHNRKATFIEKLTLKRALKKSHHILTVSENTRKDLIKKYKTESEKISVIPCAASSRFRPIPKDELAPFAQKTNLPSRFFLAVGTIIPRKNYKNLILAFSEIQKRDSEHHLIIVGSKGWQSDDISALISKHYLQKKVHFLGYLSESSLSKLYNLATALVFPSLYEGFGIPPLEAMQSGCPVIASFTSSLPEVVGDSALLIDPTSPTEIAKAMLKVARDPDLTNTLREKGLKQAKNFSWKKSAGMLLKAFKE